MFREISCEDFDRLLAAAPVSAAFEEALARFDLGRPDRRSLDAAVQEGALHVDGGLATPAFHTLVLGDLTVDGVLDLRGAYDGGGVLVVIGNVQCAHFIGEVDAQVFIDGDLEADGAVVSGFEDSSLNIVGILRAKLFIGNDIGAEVGAGAIVDYGIGHWSALGSPEGPFVRPRNGERATIAALRPEPQKEGYPYDAEVIAELIRAGKPLFK